MPHAARHVAHVITGDLAGHGIGGWKGPGS